MPTKIELKRGRLTSIVANRMERKRLAFDFLIDQAIKRKKCIAYFHYSNSQTNTVFELLSHQAKSDPKKLKMGIIVQTVWPHLIKAATALANSKLYIGSRTKSKDLFEKLKEQNLKFDVIVVHGYSVIDIRHFVRLAREMNVPVVMANGTRYED